MSEFTQSQPDPEQEDIYEKLSDYSEEFRSKIEALTHNGLELDIGSFEAIYEMLADLSVRCMSTYLALRYLQDTMPVPGEDEE